MVWLDEVGLDEVRLDEVYRPNQAQSDWSPSRGYQEITADKWLETVTNLNIQLTFAKKWGYIRVG